MTLKERAVSVVGQGAILGGIAVAFFLGLVGTVYLSLRSPEVKVPDIVGKDRANAESTINEAGLNFRVRAERAIGNSKPDTVLLQLPGAGELVKAGQTVAVDVSRGAKDGETPVSGQPDKAETPASNQNSNQTPATNLNENKPKRPKNTNKNANSNANGNANSNSNRAVVNGNRNGNANANVKPVNSNTDSRGTGTSPLNPNADVRPNANTGAPNNRRPPVTRPSPVNRPTP